MAESQYQPTDGGAKLVRIVIFVFVCIIVTNVRVHLVSDIVFQFCQNLYKIDIVEHIQGFFF